MLGASRAAREASPRGGARFGGHPEHRRVVERGSAHTVHHRVGRGHRGPLREVDVEVELALGERRDEFDADGGSADGKRSGEEPGRQREDDHRVAESGAQHRRVGVRHRGLGRAESPEHRPQRKDEHAPDLAEARADRTEHPDRDRRLRLPGGTGNGPAPAGEDRDERQRKAQRGKDGDGDRERLVAEELSGDSLHEDDGQEHGDGGQGRGDHRTRDLHRSGDRRIPRGLAPVAPAVDRLQHHDGVVEQHADPEREPAERHDVQGKPHLLHHEEGGDHRDGNGHRDHRRRPPVAEKQRDHQDGEQAPLPGVPHDLRDRAFDELRLIEEDGQRHPGGNRVLHRFELRPDAFGHPHRVRVSLLEDPHLDALGAALPQDHFLILEPGADFRHVAEPHEPPAGVLHDHRTDAVQRVQLVQRPDQVAGLVLVHAAAGEVHVVLGQRRPDLRDGDVVGGQPPFVHIHLDLADQSALDPDRGDPVHRVEILLEVLFGPLPDAGEREFPGDADPEDGVRSRVEAQQPGPLGIFRKEDAVELFPYVEPGEVHVRVPDKLQGDFGHPGAGAGSDPAEPGNDRGRLLDGAGDQRFDLDGRGARHPGLDRQGGIGDLRQQIDRQPAEGHEAEDAGGHGEHGDAHRPPDAGGDQGLHGAVRNPGSVREISCRSGFRPGRPG